MSNLALDATTALTYIGKTVLAELGWPDGSEPSWLLLHIVGVVLPMEGIYNHACFMVVDFGSDDPYPDQVFLSQVRTIRAIRHRDRHSSGNVLDRMTRSIPDRSGAALPARRNGSFVPSNGSTGAAHP